LRAFNLRCGHENNSQNSVLEERSRQIAILWNGLPAFAPFSRDLGEVRCTNSNFSLGALELSPAMKQIQLGQFDPARLLTYVLSRLIETHSVEDAASKGSPDKIAAAHAQLACSPTRAAGEILKAAERRWPSRYY
jgi:hypothetical protein